LKIKELREDFVDELSELYDREEVLSFFYILSEEFLGLKRVDIALALDKVVGEKEVHCIAEAKNRLKNSDPIQYIIGETKFYGLSFEVSQDVLIPRPETEELVDWILKDCKDRNERERLRILDIGTGSGCIAISLAKNLANATVHAMDISQEAIRIAKSNAVKNNVEIHFISENVLKLKKLDDYYDIVVSNPPYVRTMEKEEMKANVLDHEPHIALFVTDHEPLVFYEKITELVKLSLKDEGVLYFEINQYLGNETKKMIEEKGFGLVELRKDLYTNDRMIKAKLKNNEL